MKMIKTIKDSKEITNKFNLKKGKPEEGSWNQV